MFTQPIIYHPANESNRKEFLEFCFKVGYTFDNGFPVYSLYPIVNEITTSCLTITNPDWPLPKGVIDCGSNLPLAKALAALRDDSDYMQWFVFCTNPYNWRMNDGSGGTHKDFWSKATPSELISHFK